MSSFNDLSTSLFHADNYEDSFEAFNHYIQSLGLHSLSYVFMPDTPYINHHEILPRFSVSKNFSKVFLAEYEANEFQKYDYIVDAIDKGESKDLYLWTRDYKNKRVEKHQRIVLDAAKQDYQMGNGFSILTAKSKSGIGAASIVGDDADSDNHFAKFISEHATQLQMATNLFHNHIVTSNYEVGKFIMPTIFPLLTKTERTTLKCLLEGLTVPQTAEKIYRSRGHVENLVRNIRLKVGGENTDGKPRISKDELIHFCGLMQIYYEL